MAEIRVDIEAITKPTVKAKIVEQMEEGEVVDRLLVTTVAFEYEGSPAAMDKILWALQSGQQINVVFQSPQRVMEGIDSVTLKTKDSEVTLTRETAENIDKILAGQ